jgi:hypothetical protein
LLEASPDAGNRLVGGHAESEDNFGQAVRVGETAIDLEALGFQDGLMMSQIEPSNTNGFAELVFGLGVAAISRSPVTGVTYPS